MLATDAGGEYGTDVERRAVAGTDQIHAAHGQTTVLPAVCAGYRNSRLDKLRRSVALRGCSLRQRPQEATVATTFATSAGHEPGVTKTKTDSACEAAMLLNDVRDTGHLLGGGKVAQRKQATKLRGYLHERTGGLTGGWQKRWYEVNDRYLTAYKNNATDELLACIDLKLAGVIAQADKPETRLEFVIPFGKHNYRMKANSGEEAQRWVEGLLARKGPPGTADPMTFGAATSVEEAAGHDDEETKEGRPFSLPQSRRRWSVSFPSSASRAAASAASVASAASAASVAAPEPSRLGADGEFVDRELVARRQKFAKDAGLIVLTRWIKVGPENVSRFDYDDFDATCLADVKQRLKRIYGEFDETKMGGIDNDVRNLDLGNPGGDDDLGREGKRKRVNDMFAELHKAHDIGLSSKREQQLWHHGVQCGVLRALTPPLLLDESSLKQRLSFEWLEEAVWMLESEFLEAAKGDPYATISGERGATVRVRVGVDGFLTLELEQAYAGCCPGTRLALPSAETLEARVGTVLGFDEADGRFLWRADNTTTSEPVDPRPSTVYLCESVRYDVGARLLVLHEDTLVDASVVEPPGIRSPAGNRHRLRIDGGEEVDMDLNEVNHSVQRFASAAELEKTRMAYCQNIVDNCAELEDAITGRKVHTEKQTIYVSTSKNVKEGVQRDDWLNITDVRGIVPLLLTASRDRSQGTHEAQPVLVRADAGTGKTWAIMQLRYFLAKELVKYDAATFCGGVPLVPLVILVQRLARLMRTRNDSAGDKSWDCSLLFAYIDMEFEENEEWRRLLRHAVEIRSLVLIIDGVDEAAGRREEVEDLVVRQLVPMGLRVMVTSRPEGVRTEVLEKRFVFLNLDPLTETQQREMIKGQLKGNAFFEHLMQFSDIRKGHDRLYVEDAFPDEASRRRIEEVSVKDRFKRVDDGGSEEYNELQRQHRLDGQELVQAIPEDKEPGSGYLRALRGTLTEDMLSKLDRACDEAAAEDKAMSREQAIEKIVEGHGIKPPEEGALFNAPKIARKLRLLGEKLAKSDGQLKGSVSSPTLMAKIISRTDEIYCVAEHMRPVFEAWVEKVAGEAGLPPEAIKIGPMKDPVRIHEKALDDYKGRFKDGELPEACVVDVLRVRLVCENDKSMLHLMDLLQNKEGAPNEVIRVKGQPVEAQLIRCKNKFDPTTPDPTRFRNILNNILLKWGEASVYVEVQVHHKAILTFNDEKHAHAHYEYFRSLLKDSYETKLSENLDDMLEKRVAVFDDICSVPVLLSLLVVIWNEYDETSALQGDGGGGGGLLPSSKFELYSTAIRAILERQWKGKREEAETMFRFLAEATETMFRFLAEANMKAKRRAFTTEDVRRAFTTEDVRHALSDKWELWETLERGERDIPLVKTLVASASEDGGNPGQYQFKHLSFQEALGWPIVADSENWTDADVAHKTLNDKFFHNTFMIAGDNISAHLNERGDWKWADLNKKSLSTEAQLNVASMLPFLHLEKLNLSETGMTEEGLAALCAALEKKTILKDLNLSGNKLSGEVQRNIASLLPGLQIERLHLSKTEMTEDGLAALFKALEKSTTLKELDLSSNKLSEEAQRKVASLLAGLQIEKLNLSETEMTEDGLTALFKALEKNTTLKELNLSSNKLSEEAQRNVASLLAGLQIERLNLSETEMTEDGLTALFKALEKNTTLKELNLSRNSNISRDVSAVKWPEGLKVLWLARTGVSGDVSAVKWPEGLQNLNLWKTNVSDDISKAQWPQTLTVLSLNECRNITGDVSAVKWPEGLQYLFLDSTKVSGDVSAVKWPEGLQELYLRETKVSGDVSAVKWPEGLQKLYLYDTKVSGKLPQAAREKIQSYLGP